MNKPGKPLEGDLIQRSKRAKVLVVILEGNLIGVSGFGTVNSHILIGYSGTQLIKRESCPASLRFAAVRM